MGSVGKVNIATIKARFPGEDKLNGVSGAWFDVSLPQSFQGPLWKLVDKVIDECGKYRVHHSWTSGRLEVSLGRGQMEKVSSLFSTFSSLWSTSSSQEHI